GSSAVQGRRGPDRTKRPALRAVSLGESIMVPVIRTLTCLQGLSNQTSSRAADWVHCRTDGMGTLETEPGTWAVTPVTVQLGGISTSRNMRLSFAAVSRTSVVTSACWEYTCHTDEIVDSGRVAFSVRTMAALGPRLQTSLPVS